MALMPTLSLTHCGGQVAVADPIRAGAVQHAAADDQEAKRRDLEGLLEFMELEVGRAGVWSGGVGVWAGDDDDSSLNEATWCLQPCPQRSPLPLPRTIEATMRMMRRERNGTFWSYATIDRRHLNLLPDCSARRWLGDL